MANPLFRREFLSAGRSGKTLLIFGVYLGLLAGLLLLLWPAGGVQSVVSEGARKIFSIFFFVNLTLILLMTPAFTAPSITTERERNTYGALFTTLLTRREILLGKLLPPLLPILLMVLLSLPIASLCALTGGVDLLFMSKVSILLFTAAIWSALTGLACSAFCRHTHTAILLTYSWILLFSGATWLPGTLLSGLLPDLTSFFQLLRSVSSYDALFQLLYPDAYKLSIQMQSSAIALPSAFTVNLIALWLLSIFSLFIFSLFIFRTELPSRLPRGTIYTGRKKAIKRKLSFPFYLMDPLKRKNPIGRFKNPVFVAELRRNLFSNPAFLMRSISGIFILSLVLLTLTAFQLNGEVKASSVRLAAIIFQIGVSALLAPGISASLITGELQAGTFQALAMTPLSPLTILLGKLKATFFYALIFLVSSIFILLAMAYLEPQNLFPEQSVLTGEFWTELIKRIRENPDFQAEFFTTYQSLFRWIVILLLSTTTFLAAGLFASSIASNTSRAAVIAYSITAFLTIVTLFPILLQEKFSLGFSAFLLSLNPIACALQSSGDMLLYLPDLWGRNVVWNLLLIAFFLAGGTARVYRLYCRKD